MRPWVLLALLGGLSQLEAQPWPQIRSTNLNAKWIWNSKLFFAQHPKTQEVHIILGQNRSIVTEVKWVGPNLGCEKSPAWCQKSDSTAPNHLLTQQWIVTKKQKKPMSPALKSRGPFYVKLIWQDTKGTRDTLLEWPEVPLGNALYIDPIQGKNTNDGLSPKRPRATVPWGDTLRLGPLQSILFRSGRTHQWSQSPIILAQGHDNLPVKIGRYGAGPLPKLILNDSLGDQGAVLEFINPHNIMVSELELSRIGPPQAPRAAGIRIKADPGKIAQQIQLQSLVIRDIDAELPIGPLSENSRYENAGIALVADGRMQKGESCPRASFERDGVQICPVTGFNQVTLQDNLIRKTNRSGIALATYFTAASRETLIRRNLIEQPGGDGIYVDATKSHPTKPGLEITQNLVWECCGRIFPSRRTTGQCGGANTPSAAVWIKNAEPGALIHKNLIARSRINADGQAFDFDIGVQGARYENNLSYDNSGGWLAFFGPDNHHNSAKNNISIDDGEWLRDTTFLWNQKSYDLRQTHTFDCPQGGTTQTLALTTRALVGFYGQAPISSNQIVQNHLLRKSHFLPATHFKTNPSRWMSGLFLAAWWADGRGDFEFKQNRISLDAQTFWTGVSPQSWNNLYTGPNLAWGWEFNGEQNPTLGVNGLSPRQEISGNKDYWDLSILQENQSPEGFPTNYTQVLGPSLLQGHLWLNQGLFSTERP